MNNGLPEYFTYRNYERFLLPGRGYDDGGGRCSSGSCPGPGQVGRYSRTWRAHRTAHLLLGRRRVVHPAPHVRVVLLHVLHRRSLLVGRDRALPPVLGLHRRSRIVVPVLLLLLLLLRTAASAVRSSTASAAPSTAASLLLLTAGAGRRSAVRRLLLLLLHRRRGGGLPGSHGPIIAAVGGVAVVRRLPSAAAAAAAATTSASTAAAPAALLVRRGVRRVLLRHYLFMYGSVMSRYVVISFTSVSFFLSFY